MAKKQTTKRKETYAMLKKENEKMKLILSDESVLHINILRGEVPMSRATALHIAGAGDYDELKRKANET